MHNFFCELILFFDVGMRVLDSTINAKKDFRLQRTHFSLSIKIIRTQKYVVIESYYDDTAIVADTHYLVMVQKEKLLHKNKY